MTFYFYDLETSSGSPRTGRIMQFAGQRTDEHLKPIGEPDNILIKLSNEVLPEPDAILVHGITPQKTLEEGITEAEFVKYFQQKVSLPNTIFVGYNNIRFDDEFMRLICYRTFFDPYQWHWKDGRSRWDLLDPMRMMRALRPEGLRWPDIDGKPTVKLGLMAKENGFLHDKAHDALSDVQALIQLAVAFKKSQPKLYSYLLETRDKKKVANLVLGSAPYVYCSGKYKSEYQKTSVVQTLFKHPRIDAAIVYDLREDPEKWFKKSTAELVEHWQVRYGDEMEQLPVKTIKFNKCPAVAPLGVLDKESKKRILIDMKQIEENRQKLVANVEFNENLQKALDIIEKAQQTSFALNDSVDEQLYDGFWGDNDQAELTKVRDTEPENLGELRKSLKNKRIREMVPLYKARNFPGSLNADEREEWEKYRHNLLIEGGEKSRFSKFYMRLQEILKTNSLSKNDEFLLTELQLYAESIMPDIA